MSREFRPPTRGLRLICFVIGAAVFGPALYQHFGKVGATVGVLFGVAMGWALSQWIKRTFLDL